MLGLGSNRSRVPVHAVQVPVLPAIYLSRQRLIDALAGEQRLSLLCAPAGYGKSTLLCDWLSQRRESTRVVWLSLAGRPFSLGELSAALASALGLAPQSTACELLAFIGKSTETIQIILDDWPDETPSDLDAWIEQLLALPANTLQLRVSCRRRPNWNLPRLALEGELLELGAAELAFSLEEFEGLVTLLVPDIDVDARAELWLKTLGWGAGIRLLLSPAAVGGRIEAGYSPLLREYLEHELLLRLSVQEREILHGVAHLPKVSVELCDQLWDEQGGGFLFKRLLQCQAFLFPIAPQKLWFRMLPAVAQALQDGLSGAALNHLRLRSCRVLSASGHLDEAIEQALSAGQAEVAANYMERLQLSWLLTDQHLSRLLGWMEQLPPQLLESTLRLISLCARALLVSGRLDEAENCLKRFAYFLPQPEPQKNHRLLANWQALLGGLQAHRGNAEAARLQCREAIDQLAAQDWLSRMLCYSTLARVAMVAGDLPEAGQLLHEATELARRQGSLDVEVLINTDRFRLMILQGDLSLAEALLQEDLQRVANTGSQRNPLLGRLLFMQGELLVLLGRQDEGEQVLQAGLQQVRDCSAPFILHGYLMLAEVAARKGQFELARLRMHEGERRMHCGNIDEACYASAIALQHMRVLAFQHCWVQVLPIARTLEERLQGVRPCLSPLQVPSLAQCNQLLLAQAEYHTGDIELAVQRLWRLLEQCELLGFVALAGEVRQVMARIDGKAAAADVAAGSVLVPDGPSVQGGLTPREIAVLKLLAQGMSIREVSSSLFISVNTVKTHAKNINVKLGACRRTQAINSAKAMGVLI
ncbi:LuxR C-terminal-related transcriptional regulator [Aquipseudomonas ullengensis]|uniref:ATP-dependent transcriptional regulator n=1 Tax=Aquipseudomonas ullengensis TaxID=2759166 RepID=A0A7W4LPV3_9GAMM|nr:LuxR C-terminal-related transcriptional regulator [Pseudomonas ullengensis]MBB2497108.1 ATP-dependent transcriptional regulator [Pseudomonas ullengensis]